MKVSLPFIAELLLSILIIALLLNFAGAERVASLLLNIRAEWLAAGIASILLLHVVMTWRIMVVLRELGYPAHFWQTFRSHMAGMIISDFTPARSGYFAAAFSISAGGKVKFGDAACSVLAPQLMDFFLKMFAGIVALLFLAQSGFFDSNAVPYIVAGVLVISGFIFAGMLALFWKPFAKTFSFISALPFGKKILDTVQQMQSASGAAIKTAPQLFALLLAAWLFRALFWYFMSIALSLSISFPVHPIIFFAFLQPLALMLDFMPTPTLAGAGITEAGVAALLVLFGAQLQAAVAFALLLRFISIAINSIGVFEALRTIESYGGKITGKAEDAKK